MQAKYTDLFGHGGRRDAAATLWPDAPTPWLDLSTGLNPLPWRPTSPIAVDLAPLPLRGDLLALEAAAARHFGVAPSRVAAVPGSEVALRLLPMLGLPGPIVAHFPCYRTHAEIADFIADAPASGPATLLHANPNNPDGSLRTHEELARYLGPERWLVVDEAFADAVPAASILPTAPDDAQLVVLRSFGKFFGLAGVRLGFVVAPPTILEHVRAQLGDWPVSAHALAYGRAAYADAGWIARARADLAIRAARLDSLLACHGLTARGACPLFRLVEHVDAARLLDQLGRAGILVRPFTDRPDWLRFGLPADDAAFERLDRALGHG